MKNLDLSILCTSLLLAVACDLPNKQIGDETETGASASDSDDSSDSNDSSDTSDTSDSPFDACDGSAAEPDFCSPGCVPGSLVLADDCNTCECQSDQTWSCVQEDFTVTEEGCGCSCEQDGWACQEGNCINDPNPFDDSQLALCDEDVPHKEIWINEASIEGEILTVELQYGGGCEPHFFGGCWDGGFNDSAPVQVGLSIAHAGPEDFCEAAPGETVEVDLNTLRFHYMQAYAAETGVIDIHLDGWDGTLQYTF